MADLEKRTSISNTMVLIGLLVMAIAGGGVMSLIYGKLCELPQVGHQKAYLLLFICYIYILFFATMGYKFNGQKKQINK